MYVGLAVQIKQAAQVQLVGQVELAAQVFTTDKQGHGLLVGARKIA